jgi:acetyl-CoA/propionyl-CoA carboxylase biotin carboxyl carrier protein
VSDELRERMGAAALRLAAAVGYVSAGTVEFLLDDRGAFWFLEMNTRLQVEHPVTELVTGRDLVADQLRIAAGEPLEALLAGGGGERVTRQRNVPVSGHAVEVRLYAEDAESGFLPATGRVAALEWPTGDSIRVDAGIVVGDEVGGRFDPMLATIIALGPTRNEAFDRLARALDDTLVLGLTTNLRFLRWLVRQPVVRAGQVRIDTLERIWPPDDWAAAAAVPDWAWFIAARRLSGADGRADPWLGGWRLNAPGVARAVSDGVERIVVLDTGDRPPRGIRSVVAGDTVFVDVDGRSVPFTLVPSPDADSARRGGSARGAAGEVEVRSPMPGSVIAVHAGAGDPVEAGQPLITLEAMKMEHVVGAPGSGTLAELLVAPGDQVTKGQAVAVVRG